jgi:hypothetical protein
MHVRFTLRFLGIITCKGHLCWHWCNPLCLYFLDSHAWAFLTPKIFQEAHATRANRDGLIDVFRRMDKFFRRLLTYTVVPPPQSTKNSNEEIMLTVLSIITSVTEEVTEWRASKLIPYRYLIIYSLLIRKVFQEIDGEKFR